MKTLILYFYNILIIISTLNSRMYRFYKVNGFESVRLVFFRYFNGSLSSCTKNNNYDKKGLLNSYRNRFLSS